MQTLWLVDKSKWVPGPWQQEPDFVTWVDDDTHYRCLAARNILGAWEGFVGVVENHPMFFAPTNSQAFKFIDIHGGVTSAELRDQADISFVPPKRAWWIGFDCMHECDVLPSFIDPNDAPKVFPREESEDVSDRQPVIYRDLEYVRNEVGFLAMQLAFHEEPDRWAV